MNKVSGWAPFPCRAKRSLRFTTIRAVVGVSTDNENAHATPESTPCEENIPDMTNLSKLFSPPLFAE